MFAENDGTRWTGMVVALMMAVLSGGFPARASDGDRIQPYPKNPHYWQCKGAPVMLIGTSDVALIRVIE